MSETAKAERKEEERIEIILGRLQDHYGDATCALRHRNAYELLVATILSAQCTDDRVNKVTPALFERFPTPENMAESDEEELQELIRSTGFFRNKSRNLLGAAQRITSDFEGEIPETMEELLSLPGVARKTANVVLGTAFGIPAGVVVDTHVKRISTRLGLTEEKGPEKIERDLMQSLPQRVWIDFSHQVIHHGRALCKAQKPRCRDCFLTDVCPYFQETKS